MEQKIRYLAFFILLSVPLLAFSQYNLSTSSKKAIELYRQADNYVVLMQGAKAIPLLEKAIKTDKDFVEAYLRLAEAHLQTGNKELAFKTYKIGLDINPQKYLNGYLQLAHMLLNEGMYANSKIALDSYKENKVSNLDKRYYEVLRFVDFALEAMKSPVEFNPINMGDAINTEYDEYWPSLSADQKTFVFTRAVAIDTSLKTAAYNRQEDFFYSTKANNNWEAAKSMGEPINTPSNEGAQTISADGRTMVYTVCNRKGVIGRCDLYISYKKGDVWTTPVNMGEVINTKAKETQPSLSYNGTELIFASDREGGKGGLRFISLVVRNDKGKMV
jgi:tetratricopeptide (TPR) repeat protein